MLKQLSQQFEIVFFLKNHSLNHLFCSNHDISTK